MNAARNQDPRVAAAAPGGGASEGGVAIRVRGLRKRYGDVEAVRGIDLTVRTGEIFAFLGPNGAGKTTTVETLEGYRHRDAGEAEVLGSDPARPAAGWRARIGVVLQESQPEAELTVEECVSLYAGYYPRPRPVGETLELVGLADRRAARCGQLSGGQRRRLDVALALIGDPELVFLDEPTTGFDPAARQSAWQVIAGLRDLGKTIFLTTHYMEEAEHLADRIAVIAAGRIVAEGTAATLGGRDTGASVITFTLPSGLSAADLPPAFGSGGILHLARPDGSVLEGAISEVNALADGRVLVNGSLASREPFVARLNQDGSYDPTFGDRGLALPKFPCTSEDRATLRRAGCTPAAVVTLRARGLRGSHPSLSLTVKPSLDWAAVHGLNLTLPRGLRPSPKLARRGRAVAVGGSGRPAKLRSYRPRGKKHSRSSVIVSGFGVAREVRLEAARRNPPPAASRPAAPRRPAVPDVRRIRPGCLGQRSRPPASRPPRRAAEP